MNIKTSEKYLSYVFFSNEQEEDLNCVRERWSDALIKRKEYLDEQIQKIINKQGISFENVPFSHFCTFLWSEDAIFKVYVKPRNEILNISFLMW